MSNDAFYDDDLDPLMDGFHEVDEDDMDEFGDVKPVVKKKSDDVDELSIDDLDDLDEKDLLLEDLDTEDDLI
jgi:hypothetical protein